jgi:hypothetical protein
MWVLIWVLVLSGSATSGTAEFSSKETCVAAKKQMEEVDFYGTEQVHVGCVRR